LPIEKLIAADAIERISSVTAEGGRILGVDGFRVVPEGFVAALDLILDLSSRPISPEAAADEAIQFLLSNANEHIVFEVVVGNGASRG
jgi:hypothetical protein